MRKWAGFSALGFVVVAGLLFLRPDLRGWTPSEWTDAATKVESVGKGTAPFSVGDCLPGTIDAHGTPRADDDHEGTATIAVSSCRSRSSAVKIAIVYLLLALSYPVYRLVARRRGAARFTGRKPPASFPIVLHKEAANAGICEPVSLFVDYVNALLRGRVSSEDLPGAFFDLYALDFYETQVRNGGHSQFIGNSGTLWQVNLEHALRGAQMLGVEELVQVLGECRDWCEANPAELDRQDGWSNRPAVLDALDVRLYAMEYDDIAYAPFVAGLPEGVRTWIEAATEATDFQARSKYHLAAGAWLLKQPNTQLLPGRDADAAIERILKQHARTS